MDQVKVLIELQAVMGEMGLLEKEKAAIPLEVADLKAERDGREAEVRAVELELQALREERRERERELEEERAKSEKAKEKLMAIRTQKEYGAMLSEIEKVKKLNSDREGQLLSVLERFEDAEQRLAACRAVYDEAEGRYRERMVEVEARMASFDGEIAALDGRKRTVAKGLPPGVLRRFETIFERREGRAIVAARNQSCTGCHMNLSPQLFNQLRREDRIHTCPNCNRILYFEEVPAEGEGDGQG
jgi:predicted  nucleic acid-binding Zn-ribbon protein